MLEFLDKLENIRPLSEPKAWWLFRAAALSEAVGWTVLIAGILIRHYKLPGHAYAVLIAGQIHGTIFLIYFAVAIVTYTSLYWSRKKFLVALIAGIPPYGSLIFEQWAARERRNEFSRVFYRNMVLVSIGNKP